MARRSRARKPRVQKPHEQDFTWEVDGEVLHASDGWVEWGGELILSMGETSGGAPYGLSLQEYQAILIQECEGKKRMEEWRKRTWEHLTVDLGGVMGALASHDPGLVWALDLESGEAVCFDEEERREDLEEPWEDLDRYLCIHPIEAHLSFDIRTDFVEDLPLGKPRTALAQALRQRHPFRVFRDALLAHPQVREAWLKYHEDCIRSLAMAWVEGKLKAAKIRTT
jgi:hypothetical protein